MCGDESTVRFLTLGNGGLCYFDLRLSGDCGRDAGFIGTSVIIILLLFITIECIFIARKAKDMAGRLICCGMAALVGFQSIVNISVASGLLPNTGVTLPFVSYGLTSLWSLYIGIGLVLNVGLALLYDSQDK